MSEAASFRSVSYCEVKYASHDSTPARVLCSVVDLFIFFNCVDLHILFLSFIVYIVDFVFKL